jgi:transcriptional regulator with XRE-family HTH domain
MEPRLFVFGGHMLLLTEENRVALRKARLKKKCTQKQLANEIGCSNVRLCNLETSTDQPSLDLFEKWCNALDRKLTIKVTKVLRRN